VIRKLSFVTVAAMLLAAAPSFTLAQSPHRPQVPAPQTAGRAAAAIQHAAAAGKYLFVFFWQDKSQPTSDAWSAFQTATSKLADRAETVAINVSDPAEKTLVTRFGLDRSPLPLVLAIAPNGAITKGFPGKPTEDQLSQAFVSPATASCLKALQDRKLVLLCVLNSTSQPLAAAVQAARDFQADPRYAAHSEIVLLNAGETAEASFLKSLRIDPQTPQPVTVLMAPPGSVVGKFEGAVTKDQLVASLQSAQSGCCPGGKCGPGGCGPKR